MTLVSGARRASGIKYPQVYATKEEEATNRHARTFNCTQRAHLNTLEILPQYFAALLIAGLKAPRLATLAGVLWIVGRIVYTLGYASGDPQKRRPGTMLSYLGLLSLAFTAVYSSLQLLLQTSFHF